MDYKEVYMKQYEEEKKRKIFQKENFEKRLEYLYAFIYKDGVAATSVDKVQKLLTKEEYGLNFAESSEWMARFAMGIKMLDISTPYDPDYLWDMLGSYITEGLDDEVLLEDTWTSFKTSAKEIDLL